MANPFETTTMNSGYARNRPPLHGVIVRRAAALLSASGKYRRALDIGCGAGLSTAPLSAVAEQVIGIEPAESMLRWVSEIAPGARFIAARSEDLPLRAGCCDLITAAGSLNYVDLDMFFPEAARVLAADGVLVVYDFSQGRSFPDSSALDEWFEEFIRRYPPPPAEARELSPGILSRFDSGFQVVRDEVFEIPQLLTPEFYVEYALTETNVAFAIRNGHTPDSIRAWLVSTLLSAFGGRARDVLFRGYIACLAARRDSR